MISVDEGKIKITFRRKNKLSMPNVVLHIHVDHKPIGKITVNGVVYFETEPGEHEIEVFVFRGIRTNATFNLTCDSEVTIHTKLGKLELSASPRSGSLPDFRTGGKIEDQRHKSD